MTHEQKQRLSAMVVTYSDRNAVDQMLLELGYPARDQLRNILAEKSRGEMAIAFSGFHRNGRLGLVAVHQHKLAPEGFTVFILSLPESEGELAMDWLDGFARFTTTLEAQRNGCTDVAVFDYLVKEGYGNN